MTIFLLTIAVICIAIIIFYKSLNNKSENETIWKEPINKDSAKTFKSSNKTIFDYKWPFYKKKIMSNYEQGLFLFLKETFPDLHVFSQVHLTQLVGVKKNTLTWLVKKLYSKYGIKWMSVDFLLVDKEFQTLTVIEFDDISHNRQDRIMADRKKDKILSDANIKIIRIPTETIPTKQELITLVNLQEKEITLSQEKIHEIVEKVSLKLNGDICENSKSKFPQEPYQRFKQIFPQLNVRDVDILEALLWKYGQYNEYIKDKNYKNTRLIIPKVQEMWQDFLTSGYHQNAHLTFHWWKFKLDRNKENIHFPTIAHITHLIHPEVVPLIDNYTFKVMKYLITGNNDGDNQLPKDWNDILQFKKFITALSHSIPQVDVATLNHFLYSIKIN